MQNISRETALRRIPNLERAIEAMEIEIARLESDATNPLREKQVDAHKSQLSSYRKSLSEARITLRTK